MSLVHARVIADRLGIKIGTVYEMARSRRLPAIILKEGKKPLVRFDPEEVERFLRRHATGVSGTATADVEGGE